MNYFQIAQSDAAMHASDMEHAVKQKSTRERCRSRPCQLVLALNTVFLVGQGVFCLFGFGPMFSAILEDKMTIKPGTPAYEAWRQPSIPTTIRFYLFSVKNPREVEAGGKPHLEEVGPFSYREELQRVNEAFNENGTVTYETKKVWHYLPPPLSLPLDTSVTTVDVPMLATAEFGRGNMMMEWSNSLMFKARSGLFIRRTARQMLFEGYSDALLDMGSMFAKKKKDSIPMDKFGWFYKRNGTTWSDGEVVMATGTRDYREVGEIRSWKGSDRTIYPSSCGALRGTSAGFTPVDPDRKFIDYFSADICRPIRFSRGEEMEVLGVRGRKFKLNATATFGNATTNPANWCYHANLPTGVHNSTGCKGGDSTLKTFVSLPHFLDADPYFRDQFAEGSFSPDPARHSASISLQMETAIPIQVLMRLQIILHLRPNPAIGSYFGKIPEVFLPVLWFDAEAAIDEEMAGQVGLLAMMPIMADISGLVCLAGGLAFLATLLWSRRGLAVGKSLAAEKVDLGVDMRSKTLRNPDLEIVRL